MRFHIAFIKIVLVPIVVLVNQCRIADAICQRTECSCVPRGPSGVAAACLFRPRQMVEMNVGDFPSNLVSIEMSGGRELRFGTEVFTNHPILQNVKVIGVPKVFVREHSFANMTTRSLVAFEFSNAASLILEGRSWKNIAGPMSCLVSRVEQVIIQGQAFARLVNFTAIDVLKLELLEKAFWFERPQIFDVDSEVRSDITLERVKMENLAYMTFHSPMNIVRIIGSEIKKVKSEAFSTLYIEKVVVENTTLHRLESAAFSGQTLIQTLEFKNVSIHEFSSGAFLSGLSNLVITRSKMGVVYPGAVNVTLATATITDNMFSRVHSKGVVLKQWSSLTISNNTFKKVESEAFITPSNGPKAFLVGDESLKTPEFNFTGNILFHISESAFDFSLNSEHVVNIENNFFQFKCDCEMSISAGGIMVGVLSEVYDTGLCWIDTTLSRCLQLPEGFANMRNFTEGICKSRESLHCEEVQHDAAVPPQVTSIISAVDKGMIDNLEAERERRIIGSIFAIAVVGMLVVMILSVLTWIGRKGYCTKARRYLLPSTNSLVAGLTRMFSSGGVTPAASISRLSVHEYAELQRKMEEGKAPSEEPEVPQEDKATQTLPEELTQELLQSLKEKLNDPENYSEARDMIEHLYDLIKVEENCNRNLRESVSMERENDKDNVYDVIRPKRSVRAKKEVVSIGTRAPSPDKLQPYTKRSATLVTDYMEPRDRKVHTYSELPPRPDLLPTAADPIGIPATLHHVYVELPTSMANRPLPAEPTQL
ncbi:uncharacterized protein LOC106673769 [Cimex lectularius]|uniref:Right handed beta helix domain-containing protein n=1 Tax=Cimex lectularius TaxID=79782 RepID=A0A8I6SCV2_CIMLE|nr:uncharacterized protein LOC106673769 [Cimex lectularius]